MAPNTVQVFNFGSCGFVSWTILIQILHLYFGAYKSVLTFISRYHYDILTLIGKCTTPKNL